MVCMKHVFPENIGKILHMEWQNNFLGFSTYNLSERNLGCSEVKISCTVSLQSLSVLNMVTSALADPGFPRGGGRQLQRGAPTYYLANFSRKLNENEEILGQRRERASLELTLRSATVKCRTFFLVSIHLSHHSVTIGNISLFFISWTNTSGKNMSFLITL